MTGIKVEVKGQQRLLDRLNRLGTEEGPQLIDVALATAAEDVRSQIVREIQRGGRSGRTTKGHQASAPGEYPKSDSGRLASHVFARLVRGSGESYAEVGAGTDVGYGKFLEEGTTHMAPRPWLKRTFNARRDVIRTIITRAVQAAARRGS